MKPLSDISREHARKVRDHMSSPGKARWQREKVAPLSVKKELGMLGRVIDFGGLELGLRDYNNPFHKRAVKDPKRGFLRKEHTCVHCVED